MNVTQTCRCPIFIIIIGAIILIASIGLNIGLGRGVADNIQLRENQRESERIIAELEDSNRRAEQRASTAERLNREAAVIVTDALDTNAATGSNLSRANEILRQVITALQNLDLLYSGSICYRDNGMDTMGGKID